MGRARSRSGLVTSALPFRHERPGWSPDWCPVTGQRRLDGGGSRVSSRLRLPPSRPVPRATQARPTRFGSTTCGLWLTILGHEKAGGRARPADLDPGTEVAGLGSGRGVPCVSSRFRVQRRGFRARRDARAGRAAGARGTRGATLAAAVAVAVCFMPASVALATDQIIVSGSGLDYGTASPKHNVWMGPEKWSVTDPWDTPTDRLARIPDAGTVSDLRVVLSAPPGPPSQTASPSLSERTPGAGLSQRR